MPRIISLITLVILLSGVAFTASAQDVDVSSSIDWMCNFTIPQDPEGTSWQRLTPIVSPSGDWIVEQCNQWDGDPPADDYYFTEVPVNWTQSGTGTSGNYSFELLTDDPVHAFFVHRTKDGPNIAQYWITVSDGDAEYETVSNNTANDVCWGAAEPCDLVADGNTYARRANISWPNQISSGYVRFRAQSASNTSITISHVTVVQFGVPPIDAKIEASTLQGAAPLTVNLTDASLGHNARQWSILGEDWHSADSEAEYIFETPGTYYIGLTVLRHDDMYTDSDVVKITVTDYDVACLNRDPSLQDPDAWITAGSVSFQDQYVVLGPSASITARYDLLLDENTNHTVTLIADPIVPQADGIRVGIRLGSHQQYLTVRESIGQLVFEDNSSGLWTDKGPFTSFQVVNTSQVQITLKRLCVDDGTLQPAPSTCFFANYDFSQGLEGWGHDSGVVPDIVDGAIAMPDDTTVGQWVDLFPDGSQSHTYNIRVVANIGYKARDAYINDTDNTISISYSMPSIDSTLLSGPNGTSQPVSSFRAAAEPHRQILPDGSIIFTGAITVTSWLSDMMIFRATSTDPDTVVRISEICIDDDFEHHPGAWGDLITPVCHQTPAQPLNDTFGAWISWHWQNLSNFFTCDLMVMLNRMYELGISAYEFLVWSFIYIQTVLMQFVRFLSVAVEWADAHFHNIAAAGGVTTVANAETNFWDVIIALIERIFGPYLDAMLAQLEAIWRIIENAADTAFDILYLTVDSLLDMANKILSAIILFSYMILDYLLHTSNQVLNFIMDFIWMVVSEYFHIVNTILDIMAFVIMTVVDMLSKIILMVVETIVYIVIGIFDLIVHMITGLFDLLLEVLGRILHLIVDTITRLVNLIFSLIELAIFLIGTIIVGIINMIIAVIIMVVSNIMNAGTMIVAVLGAWLQADPISTPGTPNCAINPQASVICTAWWVMDNTVLGHPVGMMIIPIVTATFAIHMVLWAIGEIRQSIISAARNS